MKLRLPWSREPADGPTQLAVGANDAVEVPRHLRIETYYAKEVSHVKDLVGSMAIRLDPPEIMRIKLAASEEVERLTKSFEGQYHILFESLKNIRKRVGEDNYHRLVSMAEESKRLFEAGDHKAGSFLLQDMMWMRWTPKRKPKK